MTDEDLHSIFMRGLSTRHPNTTSVVPGLRAVEAAALERAARVCDEMQDSDWSPIQCADAIRAMIPKAQGARDE